MASSGPISVRKTCVNYIVCVSKTNIVRTLFNIGDADQCCCSTLTKIHENWNKFCNNPIVIIVHMNILSTQLQLQPVGQAKYLAPIRLLTSLVKYSGSKAKLERFLLCQITPLWQIQHSDRSDNRHPTGRTAVAAAVASVWSAASLVVSCFLRLQLNRPPATGDPPLPWYTWGWGWLRAVDHRPFLRSFPGPPPSVYAHWWFQKKVSLHGCS